MGQIGISGCPEMGHLSVRFGVCGEIEDWAIISESSDTFAVSKCDSLSVNVMVKYSNLKALRDSTYFRQSAKYGDAT